MPIIIFSCNTQFGSVRLCRIQGCVLHDLHVLHLHDLYWILAEVDIVRETISIYDSMVSVMNDSTFLKELLSYAVIIPLLLEKILWYDSHLETTQKNKVWTVLHVENTPQQESRGDCGVFVLRYLDTLARGEDIQTNCTLAHVSSYRKQLAERLFYDQSLLSKNN